MEKLYQNKQAFLQDKPKNLFIISIFLLFFLGAILLISSKLEVYDHYLTRGYVECSDICRINVVVPTNIKFQKIKLDKKYIEPKILDKTIEIDEENVISYNIYTLASEYGFEDKEIIEINFCYNKQRILRKFIDAIF